MYSVYQRKTIGGSGWEEILTHKSMRSKEGAVSALMAAIFDSEGSQEEEEEFRADLDGGAAEFGEYQYKIEQNVFLAMVSNRGYWYTLLIGARSEAEARALAEEHVRTDPDAIRTQAEEIEMALDCVRSQAREEGREPTEEELEEARESSTYRVTDVELLEDYEEEINGVRFDDSGGNG